MDSTQKILGMLKSYKDRFASSMESNGWGYLAVWRVGSKTMRVI